MIDAIEYGRALFELCEEAGKTETALTELDLAVKAFGENPSYCKLLDTPALSKDEKLLLVSKAFGEADEYVLNFIKILCERHSVYLFPKTVDAFKAFYDESRGIERVEAVTAISMNNAQIKALTDKLEAKTGKKIIVSNKVDKSILGGVIIRYSGIQLDGSVKTRLDEFGKTLSNIVM